jgi:hypothetical protein
MRRLIDQHLERMAERANLTDARVAIAATC